MNKQFKKISMVVLSILLLTTTNCFATSIVDEISVNKDGISYIYRNYEVQEKEEIEFLSTLKRQFTKDNKDYVLESISKSGGNITDTIDIQTTKEVVTNSNSAEAILKELPQIIDYAENGYIGQYKIVTDSLVTTSHNNGYKECLIEETKQYFDLDKNDLSYIPKQIKKGGMILDLLKTDWYEQTTKLVGENAVIAKYRAECYYATKKKIDNPPTYTTIATYIGTATKVTENPIIYDIEYKEVIVKKKTNYIPYIIGGTGTIFIAVVILFKKKPKKDKEASSK